MKTRTLNLESINSITELNLKELSFINGGSFWGDAAYIIGATARSLYEFGQAGGQFQNSLSSNLKK